MLSKCQAFAIVSVLTIFSVLMALHANASLVPAMTTWGGDNPTISTKNYAGAAKLVLQVTMIYPGKNDPSDESYFYVHVLYSGDPSVKEGSDLKLEIYQNGMNFYSESPAVPSQYPPSQYPFKPGAIIGINDYDFDGTTITVNIDATYTEAEAGDAWKQKITVLGYVDTATGKTTDVQSDTGSSTPSPLSTSLQSNSLMSFPASMFSGFQSPFQRYTASSGDQSPIGMPVQGDIVPPGAITYDLSPSTDILARNFTGITYPSFNSRLGNSGLFDNSLIPLNDNPGVSGSTDTGSVPDSVVNAIINCSNVEDEPLHHVAINKSSVQLISSNPVSDSVFAAGIDQGAVINEYQFKTIDGKTHTCHVEIYRDPRDWPQVQDIDGLSYKL